MPLCELRVRPQGPDVRLGDFEAAFRPEYLDVVFTGTQLDVLQHGFVLLARCLCRVFCRVDTCRDGAAGIKRQADLHPGLHEIVVVEDPL